ncbi:MAG: hypothetical protein M1511_00845, partial [Deltaproteobacteria bacterium]|nr:hypothetical protein [Deltaproteobacteria bacterium]
MRKRIAFVTSAFLSDPDLDSSFDFFAILTSEVVQNLQDKYDVVVRVPKPDINGKTGFQQKALLSDILNGSPPYLVYVVSPIDANAVAEVVFPFLKKYPAARFITVDQSLEGCSPHFKIKGVTVPPAVVPHNYHGGQLAARSLWKYYESIPRNHLPRKPKFIVVTGTGESQVRLRGFEDEIKLLSRDSDNVITINPDQPLPYTRKSASLSVSQLLEHNFELFKDTVGIFACNDELALGVCDALQWDHLA